MADILYINKDDFNYIGQVAKHCDLPKLDIAIAEAQLFDLEDLFCPNWPVLEGIIQEVDDYIADTDPEKIEPVNYESKYALVYGGTFVIKGITRKNLGLKRTLVYYAYSRYVVLNGFNDTPGGQVSKSNDFSIPKTLKELTQFADKYRSMGFASFKTNIEFLCFKKDIFTTFTYGDLCSEYGCDTECIGANTKGTGIRGSIITKN
jgi:hypothetical protein